MSELKVQMGKGEYWYGLCVNQGTKFPLHEDSVYSGSFTVNLTGNQESPLLLSSQGRYIWSDSGYDLQAEKGVLTIANAQPDIQLYEGFSTLRGAFLEASRRHFPANGQIPPKNFFVKPQYNTWVELIYDQNQKDVLEYARNILKHGLPAGILMIDDNWNCYYGGWRFNAATFPDPKAMVDELHAMGFEVMLWTCPFISPDSAEFRLLRDKGCLVKDASGQPAIKSWWNGYSAVLDLTNPQAMEWYDAQNRRLMEDYGIDGFKFDAGDASFYSPDDVTYAPVTPNQHCELWARMGLRYPYNEYRACCKAAGLPLVQRLCDKAHSWGDNGVAALLPNALAQGILGYAFGCPDMIGGGSFVDFLPGAPSLDQELFVRYAQCAALMPMMQYSAAPWRVLSEENAQYCIEAGELHLKFSEYIYSYACQAAQTCEPVIRYMEYQFPGQGMEAVTSQFMVGEKLLAAPVFRKGQTTKRVKLPAGRWEYRDGTIYDGGVDVEVAAPLDTLPYFVRLDG